MTYNFNLVNSSIKLYNTLKTKNIKGIERENIIKNTFNISISTFYNWLYLFKNLSNVDFKKHFINKERSKKITKEHIDFILQTVNTNTFIRIKGIKNMVKNKFNFSISETSIRIILIKNKITFKKAYKQINPYTDNELKKMQKNLKRKIIHTGLENIKSVDEFSIHFNERPKYCWSSKGKQFAIPTTNKNIYGKKYSLCMSVDTTNKFDFILKEKSIKSSDFNNFISKINKNKKTTFLMDNARIHHSKLFKDNIKRNKLKIIYGIPYYSKYNPIEYVFSLLRKEIQNKNCNNEKEIIICINNFINNINVNMITNTYKHILKILN